MENLQLLIHVFLILLKFKGLIMQNVTFYNEEKSWIDAANFCSNNGGVLESNVTLLLQHLSDITESGEHEDIWLGKIELLTEWTYVRGCFLIYGDFQHFVIEPPETTLLKCQMLCNKYKFYSINGKDCYCIEDIQPFHRANNCNCVGCYKVWEHHLPNFGSLDSGKHCIVASRCDGKNLKRSYENCKGNCNATCDNGTELGYQKLIKYETAADECETHESFIKWYPDNFCVTHTLKHNFWTSGRRHNETVFLKKSFDTENFQPLKCFKLDDGSEEQNDCNDEFSFFCSFGGEEDTGDIISIPSLLIPQQKSVQSDKRGGIAAGTVTSIIVVIGIISIIIFIYRRSLSNNSPQCLESKKKEGAQDNQGAHINNKTSQFAMCREIKVEKFSPNNGKFNISHAVDNKTYNHVNSNQTNLVTNTFNSKVSQEEMAKVQHVTKDCSKGVLSSGYCLAKPNLNNTEEETDPYAFNRDYDHLDNAKKIEVPITKVYDHLPTIVTDDPTYDHSNLKIVFDNEDYYDHFKIDGAHA